jgi:hypothetical protein
LYSNQGVFNFAHKAKADRWASCSIANKRPAVLSLHGASQSGPGHVPFSIDMSENKTNDEQQQQQLTATPNNACLSDSAAAQRSSAA